MNRNDRAKISKTLSDRTLGKEEKWKKVGDTYFKARLRGASREVKESYRIEWEKLNAVYVEPGDIGAKANGAGIVIQSHLKLTPIPLIIQAHEFEHKIQIKEENGREFENTDLRTTFKIGGKILINSLRLNFDRKKIFASEYYAMAAEWEIVSIGNLQEDIGDNLMLLSQSQISSDMTNRMFSRMLMHFQMSRDEYISAEHTAHRYSNLDIKNSILKKLRLDFF